MFTEALIDGFSGFPASSGSSSARGMSVEAILDAVERHALAEQDALGQYAQVGTASGDPVVALVMQLILDDEERHHGLLKRIESTLRDALNWTHSPDALPVGESVEQAVGRDLVETTRALIEEEKTGARYLRDLAHRQRQGGSDLQSLLLEVMAMDSEKHAHLLTFVRDRLEARARSATD